ncbi:MAG TPA: type II toxin-antitoxin system VapC family toxin [Allosphingosinicella sp.]|jgi:hypothetical protein|uniref:type II toxin-antitoxin system VapC family toxin n=1 Tax=Allosphingosinicella sp. TaxID=2823234 RepID=UPI002F2988B7
MILVDTNVFSELQKTTPDPKVVDWLRAHDEVTLLSTVVIAEIQLGICLTPGAGKRKLLAAWLGRLIAKHQGSRTLVFDTEAALKYGEIVAPIQREMRSAGVHDGQIAAQAMTFGCAVATRNAKHFQHPGLELIDPWTT